MTPAIYLMIGLALGLCRALVELIDYLVGWYRVRHFVHFDASLGEFAHVFFFAMFMTSLLVFFWPLWVWHKFNEYRQASQ